MLKSVLYVNGECTNRAIVNTHASFCDRSSLATWGYYSPVPVGRWFVNQTSYTQVLV